MIIALYIAKQGLVKHHPIFRVEPDKVDDLKTPIAAHLHEQGETKELADHYADRLIYFIKRLRPDTVDGFLFSDFKARVVYLHPTDFYVDYSEPHKPKFVIV